MWVEGGDIHDELLDQLGGVLAPPEDLELSPSPAELDALAAMVAARWPDGAIAPAAADESAPAVAGAPQPGGDDPSAAESDAVVHRIRWAGPRTRRLGSSAWRAGSVAAGLVLFSASAAAANGGVPLPRPVRVVAYTVGLPVDSPALDDTHQHIEDLKEAVEANDKPKAEATVRRLQTDLKKVPADEVKKAEPKVEKAIEEAVNKGVVTSPVPTTTTTTVPPASSTTATTVPSSTTVTTVEEKTAEKEKDNKERSTVTATTAPSTTTTTAPDPTTTTTAPETDGTAPGGATGDPGPGDGHTGAGSGGEPGTTPTTVPAEPTTTTTTGPPPEEPTTTTTTTVPEPTTTTTTTVPAGP